MPTPRRKNEPGFAPATGLGRDANVFLRHLGSYVAARPYIKYWSTPKRAARVITAVMLNASRQTGIYYDEVGHPMLGSTLGTGRHWLENTLMSDA